MFKPYYSILQWILQPLILYVFLSWKTRLVWIMTAEVEKEMIISKVKEGHAILKQTGDPKHSNGICLNYNVCLVCKKKKKVFARGLLILFAWDSNLRNHTVTNQVSILKMSPCIEMVAYTTASWTNSAALWGSKIHNTLNISMRSSILIEELMNQAIF